MFFLPSDFTRYNQELESMYFNVIEKVLKTVSIPVALKISYYFTNLGPMIQKLSDTGISGLVLFNRFYQPDIDLETLEVVPTVNLSPRSALLLPLRWIGILTCFAYLAGAHWS